MHSTPHQLPPEGMLTAAVDALLGESPADLDPQAALGRARTVLHEMERLAASALTSIADVDDRELFALDGAGSTRGWLRQQPAGDHGQLALARRLRVRSVVRGALEAGTIDTRASSSVCTALVTVDELEVGTGLGGGIGEDQVHGVLAHAVPDVLQAWVAFDPEAAGPLPAQQADLRNEITGRRAALAAVLLEASEGLALPVAQRLEPVFVLMARALSPHELSNALSTILNALEPLRLESEDEAFERERHFDLVKRATRGWDCKGVLDDEDGQHFFDYLRDRMRLINTPSATDAHEAAEPEMDADADADPDADTAFGDDQAPDPADPAEPIGPAEPALFGDDDEPETDLEPAADPHGAAGPGVPLLPWSPYPDVPLEGCPYDGLVIRKKRYAAFQMLLRDLAHAAPPGTGSPAPPHLSIVVKTDFLAGQPGAPHPVLDGRRLVELTRGAVQRLGCDSRLSAVILDAAGRPLAASGTHRSFTRRERDALRAQWGGTCAVNGCGLPGTIPHHVEMFSRTGQTRLADGVPFCEHHHHDVHDGKRTLRLRDGRLLDEHGWVRSRADQRAA